MATSEFWNRVSSSVYSSPEWVAGVPAKPARATLGTSKLWMALDAVTIIGAASLATLHEFHAGPVSGARGLWDGTLIHGRSMGLLLALLCGFGISLIITSRRMHLYTPTRLTSFLHEQRLSVQACFTSGLLLTGALYLIRAEDIPRNIVLITVGIVTLTLSLRRLLYRLRIYRLYDRGVGTRNVLIVGTGPEAQALRNHIENIPHLGYTFKGFIDYPGTRPGFTSASVNLVGTLDTLFIQARKQFVDEIFFATPCEQGLVREIVQKAQHHGVDFRVVPDFYAGLAWNSPIEYIGQFPTIPLHRGYVPEISLLLKRVLDIVFSTLAIILLAPVFAAIAIAVRLDSPGPIFYSSERIGKKGRVFRCFKFRTMVRDAERRLADIRHLNERDSVMFKISNDPRVTKVGCFLRKYSLDELPQFFNALIGDMSIVGPRPPIASEVREYKLSHLRRLDVTPGITGLWQVQARQDPSFDNYISLDMTYIENWNVWLDLKIIARTIGVVLAGTGS
jgi:exopolysaccharide biosynthesis polyprenyl glycosylphosphotransferase